MTDRIVYYLDYYLFVSLSNYWIVYWSIAPLLVLTAVKASCRLMYLVRASDVDSKDLLHHFGPECKDDVRQLISRLWCDRSYGAAVLSWYCCKGLDMITAEVAHLRLKRTQSECDLQLSRLWYSSSALLFLGLLYGVFDWFVFLHESGLGRH
jgi:hypothetical protein